MAILDMQSVKSITQQPSFSPLQANPSKQNTTANIATVERAILAADNFHRERDILIFGSRHWSKAMHNQLNPTGAKIAKESSHFEQGFIDLYDQFMTRMPAWRQSASPWHTASPSRERTGVSSYLARSCTNEKSHRTEQHG